MGLKGLEWFKNKSKEFQVHTDFVDGQYETILIDAICWLSYNNNAKTWLELFNIFWNKIQTYINKSNNGRIKRIILVFDKSQFVYDAKVPEQSKRQQDVELLQEKPDINDFSIIPSNWRSFWGKREWRIDTYQYIVNKIFMFKDLGNIELIIDGINLEESIPICIKKKQQQNDNNTKNYCDNIKSFKNEKIELPQYKNTIGEADMCILYWLDQFRNAGSYVVTVDTDYYITLLIHLDHQKQINKLEKPLYLHFMRSQNNTECIHVNEFYHWIYKQLGNLYKNPILSFAVFAIVGGNDFVEKLPNVGYPKHLDAIFNDKIKEKISLYVQNVIFENEEGAFVLDENFYMRLVILILCIKYHLKFNKIKKMSQLRKTLDDKKRKNNCNLIPSVGALRACARRILWNIKYWFFEAYDKSKVPDPLTMLNGNAWYGWIKKEQNKNVNEDKEKSNNNDITNHFKKRKIEVVTELNI